MRKYLEDNDFHNIDFMQNNSFEIEDNIIVGTRGWTISEDSEDKRLVERETIRLGLSIKDGIEKFGSEKPIIAFMHYPPITIHQVEKNKTTVFVEILKKYNIKECIYGHLHSNSIKEAVEGEYQGINFKLVSADGLDFKLFKLRF